MLRSGGVVVSGVGVRKRGRTRWSVASPSKEWRKSFDPKVPIDLMA